MSEAAKRKAEDAGLENPQDPKACKPRRGVSPSLVLADAAACLEAFKRATGAVDFFVMKDEEKRLQHGAVVTPAGGYVFFEDLATDCFAQTRKVSFEEYRDGNKAHVALHANVEDAKGTEERMLASGGVSLVPVERQFWGAEMGIVKDARGVIWSLSTKKGEAAVETPQPPAVRACLLMPEAEKYLKFLKEVFGKELQEEELCEDKSGLVHAEIFLSGSGISIDRGDKAAVSLSMTVPPTTAKAVEERLVKEGSTVVSEAKMKFYGQVQGRLTLPWGVQLAISEPRMKDGPTDADVKAYIQVGEEHGWDFVCTLRTLPFTKFAGVRSGEKVEMKKLREDGFFPKGFKDAAAALGSSIKGPAMAVYHFADPKNMVFTVTAGFPVADDFALPAEETQLTLGEIKTKRHAFTCLAGDYEQLPKAWKLLGAWHKARGCSEPEEPQELWGLEVYRSCGPPETDLYMPAPNL